MDASSIAALLSAALSAGSAAPEDGEASAPTASISGPEFGSESLSKRADKKWINRWAPERGMLELGVYGGVLFVAPDHELFETNLDRPNQGFRRLNRFAPEVGARIGYFPIRYFGIEAEGGVAPTQTRDEQLPVSLWTARAHVVGQLGWWSVTPFVLAGGGVLAASSGPFALGNDIDPELHFGLGAKAYINRRFVARIELRDVVTAAQGPAQGATNNLEVLLGLSFTLGRERDRDRAPKIEDVEPPPEEPSDRDGDGFLDPDDTCPDEAGIAPDGCPARDTDGDGFFDPDDECPETPGVEPDGCPVPDTDKDGIIDTEDACPEEMETFNGYEDTDGCPDGVPKELEDFNGALDGVFFQIDRAVLQPGSKGVLEAAAATLLKFPKVRVEVSGHTDSTGSPEHNVELSQERAAAVKAFLVEAGVDENRIQTRGAGADEPIDTNNTKEGRARNRRIEFRIL